MLLRCGRFMRKRWTGRGFADIVFLPLPHTDKPAVVVELKYGKSAEAAVEQIKERDYAQALGRYRGKILLVGINYDKDSRDKPRQCVIGQVCKQ